MTVVSVKNFAFDTKDKIGEGSTGSVYKGINQHSGNVVAIKSIKMSSINNEVTKYLLQNQIQALKIVDHPNLVKNYDIVRNKDFTYIIMEYCPSNLKDFIKNNKGISEDKILQLFKQIVEGYKCLKDHKIVHRDLKPSNILMTPDLIPKITDFGYCEIEGYLPKPKMFYNVGSPSYMSPEAITKNIYSQKSDVWALGSILYEMINGQTFDKGKKQTMEAILSIGKNGIQYNKPVSSSTKEIIKQCLQLNPTKRITLGQLRNMLNLEVSSVHNTDFYKEDSNYSHQIANQTTIIRNNQSIRINPHQFVELNRQPHVMNSVVYPKTQQQYVKKIPSQQEMNNINKTIVRNSYVPSHPQQIHQIPVVAPKNIVHQVPQTLHQTQLRPKIRMSTQHPYHQNQNMHMQQSFHNPNVVQVARRSRFEQQPSRRHVSISPGKNIQSSPHLHQRKVNLNSSIGQISPVYLVHPADTLKRQVFRNK